MGVAVEPRGFERSPKASEIPIVRSFVACREIVADSVANTVSLTNLIHVVEPLPGEVAPYIVEPLALYALLTNGRGVHQFAVELVRFDMGQEQVVGRVGPVRIDLGQDPVVVHGLPIPLRNVVFSQPGQCAFHLVCDGQDIADEKILVR